MKVISPSPPPLPAKSYHFRLRRNSTQSWNYGWVVAHVLVLKGWYSWFGSILELIVKFMSYQKTV